MSLRFAPDKLALLLSLVPYLDDVGEVSVTDAARHFRVDADDIRAAVNLIALSGVPSVGNVALHNDMFDIDWDAFLEDDLIVLTQSVVIEESPRMSRAEATALIAALQLLAALPGSADNDVLYRLLRKLGRAGGADSVVLTAATTAPEATRAAIAEALAAHLQLTFDYTSSDGRSEQRRVDVVQVEAENDAWYVRAWCHDREAMRVFRLDRMTNVECTQTPAVLSRDDVVVSEHLFDESPDDFEVQLEVQRNAIGLLGEFARGARIPKSGDPVQLTVRVAHVHRLKRIVAAHPQLMRVVAPAAAVAAVHDWAAAALDGPVDTD